MEQKGETGCNIKAENNSLLPFVWKDLDMPSVLANESYEQLFNEVVEHQNMVYDEYDSAETREARVAVSQKYRGEEEKILGRTLANPKMRGEFKYYNKHQRLEQLSQADNGNEIDVNIREILKRFVEFPLSLSGHSCSGHVRPGTNSLEGSDIMLLGLTADKIYSPDEQEAQDYFFEHLQELNNRIRKRLGDKNTGLYFIGERYLGDDYWEEIPLHEARDEQQQIYLSLSVCSSDIQRHKGKETLIAVWEEIWEYLNEIQGKDLPFPSVDPDLFEAERDEIGTLIKE